MHPEIIHRRVKLFLLVLVVAMCCGALWAFAQGRDGSGNPYIPTITFPEIPDSASQFGIGKHPSPGSNSHQCLSAFCCNLKDCRPLESRAVASRPDGWVVTLPDGGRELIPFDSLKIRRTSAECLAEEFAQSHWACYHKEHGNWAIRCFYPMISFF